MNKAAAVLSAFVALLAAVGAYDFSDTYFNQYLASELQDFYSAPESTFLHIRNRRDDDAVDYEKCRRWHGPPMCCGKDLHQDLVDRDVKRQCFQEVFGIKDNEKPRGPPPDPFKCEPHNRRNQMKCVFQCVGQKQNLIDENGQLKEKETKDFTKNSFSKYNWIKSKDDEIIEKCIAETKDKLENWKKRATDEKDNCSPATMIFSHCVFKEIQMNCPDEEIEDKKMCERIRGDIAKYGDFPPPPPPPGNPMDN